MREERALESADDDFLIIADIKIEVLVRQHVFFCQRRVGDQPVVCIQRDAQTVIEIKLERMRSIVFHATGVNIARQTDFERDAVVVDVVQQVAVFFEANAVPDAMRAAVMNRLMDRFRPKVFTRVKRRVDVVFQDQIERFAVVFCREVFFDAREIETDDAAVLERDRQFGEAIGYFRRDATNSADDDAGLDLEISFCHF